MKPISVRFRCFGPYMEEQFIDFTQLEPSGLFLISGETGAGKTTILDAICYALYNQSSGSIRGKGLSVMRCKQAQKSDITLAEFVFSANGTRYKFLRTLEFKRKNARDEHQCWEERDGAFVPLFENPKDSNVTAMAQNLIGLTYDQFRQVIILPQGQFEKLLISDSDEKEKILVTLFHASRWQRVAEEVYRRIRERETALKLERQKCADKLREYGCETTQQLQEQINALNEALDIQQHQAAELAMQASQLQTQKEQAMLLDEAFRQLEHQKQALTALQLQQPQFERLETRLNRAAAAQAVNPQYTFVKEQRQSALRAEQQFRHAQASVEQARKAMDVLSQRQQRLEEGREQQELRTTRKAALEARQPVYAALQEQKLHLNTAEGALTRCQKALEETDLRFTAAHDRWIHTQTQQADAISAYQQAQNLYLQNIGSILAQSLQEGSPCPVCGSTVHPAPAPKSQTHITEAQLEQLNQAMTTASDRVSAAAKNRSLAEQKRQEAADLYAKAREDALSLQTAYQLSLEQRISGIESLTQLNAALQQLQREISAYEQEASALQRDLQAAVSNLAAAESRLEHTGQASEEAAQRKSQADIQWREALLEAGFTDQADFEQAGMEPAELEKQRKQLLRYRQDLGSAQQSLAARQEALSGKEPPDMQTILAVLMEAQNASQSLQKQVYLQTEKLKQMRKDHSALEGRFAACEAAAAAVDADLEFADRLRGSRGLSLQRYVLGVMLSSITAEANRLLQHVYGGRYRLYRSQEPTDRRQKSGLDLEVLDNANGQRRSVKTLSGGEKFLVALALAIGLSTVVQAQGGGVRLGAMFIDEGFGSLDRDAVCDALDILDGIRKGSGLVGIISHVDQLAETIPAKIEVKKGRNGSTCSIIC